MMRALLLVEWDGTKGVLDIIVDNKKFPDGFGVSVAHPTPDQILGFAIAQSNRMTVGAEEALARELKRPERIGAIAALRKAMDAPLEDQAEVLCKEKELAYHWLRIPVDARYKLALELKLIEESQVTKLKPRDLNLAIVIAARNAGVKEKLWDLVNDYRRKWGESGGKEG